jgi:hypothetical protein
MTAKQITSEAAEAALVRHDWIVADMYCWQRFEQDPAEGHESLKRLEAAALPVALSGEKYAQSVIGNVHILRYLHQPNPNEDTLANALHWYALAARQDGGEPMIEEVRHWYVEGKAKGFRLEEAERFLRDPEIAERYRRYGGREVL